MAHSVANESVKFFIKMTNINFYHFIEDIVKQTSFFFKKNISQVTPKTNISCNVIAY